MDKELIRKILEEPESVWIKVPEYIEPAKLPINYDYNDFVGLQIHHIEETTFLINLVKELDREVLSCWIDSGRIKYTGLSDNDLPDNDFQNKYNKPF